MALKKLNLGCGSEYLKGWVNLDWNENVKVDVKHNLTKLPYPFKKDTFDLILIKHVLEHIDPVNPLMEEVWRISKKGGRVIIRVPHWSHYNAWVNIEHQRAFCAKTLDGYEQIGYYSSFARFKVLRRDYHITTPDKPMRILLNNISNPVLNGLSKGFVETILCKYLPIYEIEFELEVLK